MDGRLAMKQQQGEYITTSRFGLVYVDFLKEWLNKPIRDITRDMVQAKYKKICSDTGTAAANKTIGCSGRFTTSRESKQRTTFQQIPCG
jgi:hypothetical protein